MGFFKKNIDPISERARCLNQEIASLEAQIQQLAAQREKPVSKSSSPPPKSKGANGKGRISKSSPAESTADPLFENLKGRQVTPDPRPKRSRSSRVQKRTESAAVGGWQRFLDKFRESPPTNPKLVNYLAAGSIQGLRPLRYEKRVARNRFLFWVFFLILLTLGILTSFIPK